MSKRRVALEFQRNTTINPKTQEKLVPRSISYLKLKDIAREYMDERMPSPDKPSIYSKVKILTHDNPYTFVYTTTTTSGGSNKDEEHHVNLQRFRPDPRNHLTAGEEYDSLLHFREESNVMGDEEMVLRSVVIYIPGLSRGVEERKYSVL